MELVWCIIIAISLLLVYIIISKLIGKYRDKIIVSELEEIAKSNDYSFKVEKNKKYDFVMENSDNIIYIKLVVIPSNSSVTINSKDTWCLRWGGKRKGRNYPNMRYLKELTSFLNNTYNSSKNVISLVLLYPTTEVILKYLNESEIATVTPSSVNYGIKALKYDELKDNFNSLFITKERK